MNLVAIFDPSITTSDTFTVPMSAANGKMVVYNESNISLKFSFQDGSTAYVPAWTAMLFHGPFGDVNVTWTQQAVLTSNNPPLSQVIIETYACGEVVPGTFPAPLVRQTNIGNSTPLSTSATSIQNDGNVANTSIVEATVQGDGSSCVSLTNDGQFSIGNATHTGKVSFDNGTFKSDGSGNVTTKNITTVAGDLTLGTSGATGGHIKSSNTRLDINGLDTYLYSGGAGNIIHLQVNPGTDILTVGSGGVGAPNGVNFNIGRIKDINNGSALSGTINHGLSGTPGVVLVTCNTSNSSATVGASNYTSTQFTLTVGGGLNGAWVAYR